MFGSDQLAAQATASTWAKFFIRANPIREKQSYPGKIMYPGRGNLPGPGYYAPANDPSYGPKNGTTPTCVFVFGSTYPKRKPILPSFLDQETKPHAGSLSRIVDLKTRNATCDSDLGSTFVWFGLVWLHKAYLTTLWLCVELAKLTWV